MTDLLCLALLCLCAAVGAVHLCGWVWGALLCPREQRETVYLLPVHCGDSRIEYRLRCAAWTLHWNHLPGRSRLVLVDFGADDETLGICRAFLAGNSWAQLCTPDEVDDLLRAHICKTL